jgi:hypothetical protein
MKKVCKCHGVSGSCTLKVCWNVMPDFRVIGNELVKRYNLATQIKDERVKSRVEKLKIITSRRSVRQNNGMISNLNNNNNNNNNNDQQSKSFKDDLLFVDRSPNFCQKNARFDTLGTQGRVCHTLSHEDGKSIRSNYTATIIDDSSSIIINSCEYLCCGRGYYSKVTEMEEECECEFQWCCSVKCKKCKKKIVQYVCS